MTLNNWVNSGGAMLSNRCASLCCQEIGCNEEQLREMHIHDIYALAPLGGKVAKREIDRCSISHLTKIVNQQGTLDPLFAVRVLTYQGRIEYADADLVPHLREIYNRYEELKGVNDFATAGLTARSEWLARYMKIKG